MAIQSDISLGKPVVRPLGAEEHCVARLRDGAVDSPGQRRKWSPIGRGIGRMGYEMDRSLASGDGRTKAVTRRSIGWKRNG